MSAPAVDLEAGKAGIDSGKERTATSEKEALRSTKSSSEAEDEPNIRHGSVTPAHEVARARHLQRASVPLRFLSRGEEWLDEKMGIETQGIDRIPEEAKRPPPLWNTFFMWWSMTCHVGTIPMGVLGPEMGLSLGHSASAVVVGTFLGALCTAYCGTLGPKTGLRAIATSRYSFGFWGAKLCSVLNVIVGGGFAVVNVVITGQMLSAVSNYTMTISVGCVIVAVISYVISVFGFSIIHTFERYSWIISFILIVVLYAQAAPHVYPDTPASGSGLAYAGSWLSFMAICFSSASGWCSIAADYYCNYPASTSSLKVFGLTVAGVTLPTVFATFAGACLGNGALLAEYEPWNSVYETYGLGGLLHEVYHPDGWSKFCLVILTFSVLGNNIAINYSSGLSLQLLGHYFHAVPRFIWSFLVALVVATIAIVGKDHLSSIVSDFVSMLGYWTISFTLILLIEDKIYRRGPRLEAYNLEVWDTPGKLPPGIAAVTSLLAGYLAGGLPGMAQTWYIGAIAQHFGSDGGDVGIFMSGAITIVVYIPLRYLERKKFGR